MSGINTVKCYFDLVICCWNPVQAEQDFKFSVFGGYAQLVFSLSIL